MEGLNELALSHLKAASSLAPDFAKAINNLGIALLRTGRADEAVTVLKEGLELHPADVPILTNLARAYQELGLAAAADELFAQIEDVNQTNPYFFVYRGDMQLAQGDHQRALEYMRQALRTDSEVPEVHLGLVRVFLALGDFKRARHHVGRALKLDATHEEARKYAALLSRGEEGTP